MSSAAVDEQYEDAKLAAREQWRQDLDNARQRYTTAIRAAEAAYERDRVKRAA